MSGIRINLFNNFEITKDGEPILESLSNTRKTKLFLAYLILNKNKIIPHKELFELLWSGQEYLNHGTALRTLLYRYRNLIAESGYNALDDSITSKRGAYQWNSDIDVDIDIDDFEDYATIGLNPANSNDKRKECLESALDLYRGPLLSDFLGEHWVVSKEVYYRDLFVRATVEYAELLKAEGNEEGAINALNKAVEKAGHSDLIDLNISLLNGTDNELVEADAKYNILKDQIDFMGNEIDKLQRGMESDDNADSAFVCDYETFKDVYHLQRRLLARTGETMFVSLITVSFLDGNGDNLKNERVMKALLDSTKKCLRCGDSICRYSDECLAVMFPAGTYKDAKKIAERIRARFLAGINDEDMIISYKVRPLKNVKD